MLVYLQGTPTWRPENIASKHLELTLDIYVTELVNQTFKWTLFLMLELLNRRKSRDKYIFFKNTFIALCHACTAIALKFKICLVLDEASCWIEKLFADINLPPLMPDNSFGGSLALDFKKSHDVTCNPGIDKQSEVLFVRFRHKLNFWAIFVLFLSNISLISADKNWQNWEGNIDPWYIA